LSVLPLFVLHWHLLVLPNLCLMLLLFWC